MKIALVIPKYFPGGGLQSDLRRIADECAAKGYETVLFTSLFAGERDKFDQIYEISLRRFTAPARLVELSRKSLEIVRKSGDFDLTIGFGRLPGMDLYFYGDDCYYLNYRIKSKWEKIFNFRINKFLSLDKAPFSPFNRAKVMLLAEKQREDFVKYYSPLPDKIIMLPPGIDRKFIWPGDEKAGKMRYEWREKNRIGQEEKLLIFVGGFLFNKGADRLIEALAKLSESFKLMIFGQVGREKIEKLIRSLNLENRVFFGDIDEVYPGMLAADILVHPARKEATGTVLAEALALHLPVICSANCGYSDKVAVAGGTVLDAEASPMELAEAITQAELPAMREGAARYAAANDFYGRSSEVIKIIDRFIAERKNFSACEGEKFYLNDFFADLWSGQDPLIAAEALQGKVFRQVKNRVTLRTEIGEKGYFLKFHRGIGWRELWKNLFSFKLPIFGADNEFMTLRRLNAIGVGTMTVAAFGSCGLSPLRRKSFIITEEISGGVSLEDLAATLQNSTERREIAARLGHAVGKMHRNGIAHRDCYLCHFLRDEVTGELYVIDLHRAIIRKKLSNRLLAKDLGALAFSALNSEGVLDKVELGIFWRAYRAENNTSSHWRQIRRRAAQRCAKLHSREQSGFLAH